MAELTLTEAEKAAALWSDLDDAALGKLVKKHISIIETAAAQMDRVVMLSAAMLICCEAAETNATTAKFEIGALTQAGQDFGDWLVTATRVEASDKAITPVETETVAWYITEKDMVITDAEWAAAHPDLCEPLSLNR